MAIKADLKSPASLEFDIIQHEEDINVRILDQSIRAKLPLSLLRDYEYMICGSGDLVSPRNKTQIRKIVKQLL
jgi:hypothetical protein